MGNASTLPDLAEHLVRLTGLGPAAVGKLLEEFVAYFEESIEHFVVRRHRELREDGWRNDAIFEQLARELPGRRFAAPTLSPRQIRRLIYG